MEESILNVKKFLNMVEWDGLRHEWKNFHLKLEKSCEGQQHELCVCE